MLPDRVIDHIREYAGGLAAEAGLELVDVQFRRESHGWVLRVFIDGEDGITVDDCALISRELGTFLDVEDCIEHAYHLEVSSPGLDRPLYKKEDYQRFCGRAVKVTLKEAVDSSKVVRGTIERVEDDLVMIRSTQGPEMTVQFENIAKARLVFEETGPAVRPGGITAGKSGKRERRR